MMDVHAAFLAKRKDQTDQIRRKQRTCRHLQKLILEELNSEIFFTSMCNTYCMQIKRINDLYHIPAELPDQPPQRGALWPTELKRHW